MSPRNRIAVQGWSWATDPDPAAPAENARLRRAIRSVERLVTRAYLTAIAILGAACAVSQLVKWIVA